MKITFVKKILMSGEPCQKCLDVEKRLKDAGQMTAIDTILVADERDPTSAGMKLAAELDVKRAPFFVVEQDNGETEVFTVYFKFAKQILGKSSSQTDQAREILNDNPDLDFI